MPALNDTPTNPRPPVLRRLLCAGLAVATSTVAVLAGGVLPANAAGHRVNLRVLVVSAGDPATTALAAELDREGIPATTVTVGAAGRPTIDAAFLEDAAAGTARYQAVFLPNQAGGGLSAAELTALAGYEAAYGIRQVDGYDYPSPAAGLNYPTYAGSLDGAAGAVTPAGLAGPFGYLKGALTVDDIDPAVLETYGYLATASSTLPTGQTFTPLVNATVGSTTGVLTGVFGHDGREELIVAAGFNQYMQWFNTLAPGIVSWATRGVHLGHQRNYFNVQVDDVFLADSRWSATGNCTPGDGCVDSTVTTTDIRMTPAEVTNLVAWQRSRGFALDLVFNGGGSEAAKTASATGSDPLTTALLAEKGSFRWVNHTYTHQFLGCTQVAAVVVGATWHCATTATEQPLMDAEIASAPSGGVYWAAGSAITQQVGDNITWATTNALPNFDPTELVTGEHSGLATLPQQTVDNPFLAPALASLGVKVTASDASRETAQRTLAGGSTSTVPRHPMNIFYNAGTYLDEVDEYNWIYTSAANGGSGICENNASSTCITPLPAATNAQAKASFDSYIKPLEVRNALKYILTNDPRPFYAHQSNLAEDAILYPAVDGVLTSYGSVFDTTKTPLVQTGLTGQYQALARMTDWKASGAADGYLDSTGVHLPAATVAVPVTVPAGSVGTGLTAYAGSLSGWVPGSTVVVPPTAAAGYLVAAPATVPGAPTAATAAAGSTTASVTFTPPASDGGSPITGYTVRAFAAGATTAALTVTTTTSVPSVVVTGLTNGTSYRFDVAAVNLVGTGPASALTAAITPSVAQAPVPLGVLVTPGNASASVVWTAPTVTAGVTGYRVRAFLGTGTVVVRTVTVAAGVLSASIPGLVNGTSYTVEVASLYGTAAGPASARSAAFTPSATAQAASAPTVVSLVPANRAVTVSWQPETAGAVAASGYRVRAYAGTGSAVARTVTVAAGVTTAVVTGLTNGVAYTFDVTVLYPTSTGATSPRSVAVVPVASVAGSPGIGTAAAGRAGGAVTATARWSAPASNGGSAITGYVVTASQLAADGSVLGTTTSALLGSGTRSYAMTLPVIGQYSFTVVARNALGDSPASAASNIVTGQ